MAAVGGVAAGEGVDVVGVAVAVVEALDVTTEVSLGKLPTGDAGAPHPAKTNAMTAPTKARWKERAKTIIPPINQRF